MKNRSWQILSLGLIAAVLLAACAKSGTGGDTTPKGPVTLKVAYSSDASTLDPHLASDTVTEVILKNIYNNLVRFNEKMEIVADLAEKWSVSDDKKVWTFTLKKDVTFQDGTAFNADAVKFNIDRVLNKETASPRRSILAPITKVEVSGPLEVKLTTANPVGPMLQYLAHPVGAMVSPAAVAKYGKELGRNPVGTGPFMFDKWTANDKIVLKKNPQYFENEVKVDTLEFDIVPEAATRALLIESGQVDAAVSLPTDAITRLANDKNVKVNKIETVKTTYIAMNIKKGGPFANEKVRQAINYAVDKKAIVDKILAGLGRIADSPISNTTFGYSAVGAYEYNPEKAKQLLTEAGYANGFKFEIWTPDGRYLGDRQISEFVQAQLDKVGIKVSVRTWEFQALLNEVKKGEFDAVLLSWSPSTGDADHALYPVFHSSQFPPVSSNRAFFADKDVDQLLVSAQTMTDVNERKQTYAQIEKLIYQKAPWIFLVNPMEVLVSRSNVTGIESLATEHILFARAAKK